MKRNQNRVRKNGSAEAAARQAETVQLTMKRLPLGKSGVRLQFYKAETGKKWLFVDFKTELMAIIDRFAKRAKMNAGQFIFMAVESQLSSLETKVQGQGRAA
jgi:hypothetical protein